MFNLLELTMDNVLVDNNPILRQKAKEVEFPLNNATKMLINKMENFLVQSNDEAMRKIKNLEPALGIAAPQVGNSVRIFSMINVNDEKPITVINPKILTKSVSEIFLEAGEGCLSVRKKKPGYVYRAEKIEVEYLDKFAQKVQTVYTGLQAIVFQHEYDHLEGILYIDKINDDDPFYVKENSKEL